MTIQRATLVSARSGWTIPAYAQTMLWVRQDDRTVQADGTQGHFSLDVREGEPLFLAWGTPDGPALFTWAAPTPPAPHVAGWQGGVNCGGFVERLHILDVHDLELVIAEVVGGLLPPTYRRLPTLDEMRTRSFTRADEDDRFVSPEHTYTLLAPADSIYADYLHHAMVSELLVDCWAALAPDDGGWSELVGLPLLIEGLSLLAPGVRAASRSHAM